MRRSALVVLLLLAFLARVIQLQGRALWYDEAFAVLYSSLTLPRIVQGTVTPVPGAGAADVHPLLYYFLLHGWMELVGQSPLAVRFLSAMLGMITVALLWRLASWCFGHRTGMVVGLLAAINPFHVAYSQEARMYALLALSAVMTSWGLLRALEGGRRGDGQGPLASPRLVWWSVYVVGGALTLYAHNLGAFVLLALHMLAATRRRWWRHFSSLALADMGVLILFGPWLVGVLPGQIGFVGRSYWLSSPGGEEIVRALMLPVLTFYEPAPLWLLGIGLFTSLLLLVLLLLQACRLRSQVYWFLLLCWVPVLLLLLISHWRPVYLERALLPSALFYLVAAGWLLIQGGLTLFMRLSLAGLLMASTLGALGVHYTYARFPRPPFEMAVAFLEAHLEPGDVVVHTSKLTYFPMYAYNPDMPGVFLADPPGAPQDTLAYPTQKALGIFATPTITEAVGNASRAWLVYFPREVREARAMMGEHAALRWMDDRFLEVRRERFGDLVIALYRREAAIRHSLALGGTRGGAHSRAVGPAPAFPGARASVARPDSRRGIGARWWKADGCEAQRAGKDCTRTSLPA
jgi:hypothetical protein